MTANRKRFLLSHLVLTLEKLGYSVSTNDSVEIVVFTDKAINASSVRIGDYKHSFLTSFGPVGAEKFIASNRNEVSKKHTLTNIKE